MTNSNGSMTIISRSLLFLSGVYWGCLIYLISDICVGAKNCQSGIFENLMLAGPAALVFWLPAVLEGRKAIYSTVVSLSSAMVLLAFLAVFLGSGSFWDLLQLSSPRTWMWDAGLFLSGVPLVLLLGSLLVLVIGLAESSLLGRISAT